ADSSLSTDCHCTQSWCNPLSHDGCPHGQGNKHAHCAKGIQARDLDPYLCTSVWAGAGRNVWGRNDGCTIVRYQSLMLTQVTGRRRLALTPSQFQPRSYHHVSSKPHRQVPGDSTLLI